MTETPIIQRESLISLQNDGADLFKIHHEMAFSYKDSVPLDIKWDELFGLEEAGKLICITVRLEGKIIGYATYILHNHRYYSSLKVATNDTIFVHPSFQRSGFATSMIKESEDILRAAGVNKVQAWWNMDSSLHLGPMLEHQGYQHEQVIYGKLL